MVHLHWPHLYWFSHWPPIFEILPPFSKTLPHGPLTVIPSPPIRRNSMTLHPPLSLLFPFATHFKLFPPDRLPGGTNHTKHPPSHLSHLSHKYFIKGQLNSIGSSIGKLTTLPSACHYYFCPLSSCCGGGAVVVWRCCGFLVALRIASSSAAVDSA